MSSEPLNRTAVRLGEAIRKTREEWGESQAAVAAERGKSQAWLSYIEAGKREPGLDDLVWLLERFGVTLPFGVVERAIDAGTLPLSEFTPECSLVLETVVRAARRRVGLPPGARRLDVRATRAAFAAGTLGTVGDHPAGEDAQRNAEPCNANRDYPHDVQHGSEFRPSEAERQAFLRRVQRVDPRERRAR